MRERERKGKRERYDTRSNRPQEILWSHEDMARAVLLLDAECCKISEYLIRSRVGPDAVFVGNEVSIVQRNVLLFLLRIFSFFCFFSG